jgi:hypothetical protein
VIAEKDGDTFAPETDDELVKIAKPRVGFEQRLGGGHVRAVDSIESITVLEAEHPEQRILADAKDRDAADLALPLLRDDSGARPQRLRRLLQDLVDDCAVYDELARPDLTISRAGG